MVGTPGPGNTGGIVPSNQRPGDLGNALGSLFGQSPETTERLKQVFSRMFASKGGQPQALPSPMGTTDQPMFRPGPNSAFGGIAQALRERAYKAGDVV